MQEVIGKVRLNLDYYSGRDLYDEGASEDEILEIVKNVAPCDYNRIINERKSWSVLYHLSNIRGNIVSFLPITKNDDVLEIGSGCGAITGALADMAGSVTCIELSKKRSTINAYKNKDKDNIEIMVGNFQTVEKQLEKKYDYITLIGVYEYAASYIESVSDAYEEFMSIVAGHLKENGRLIIAIENKYGMKYFAGCREDHVGMMFEGIEGYPRTNIAKTFSKERMMEYANKAGLTETYCYYPYPDYKLPMAMYSDERLPRMGELLRIPSINFDQDRYVLFNEAKALEECVKEHTFGNFANSFLFVFGRQQYEEDRTVYVKYSDDRSEKFMISTGIQIGHADAVQIVYKEPESRTAAAHVNGMYDNYVKLEAALKSERNKEDEYAIEYNHCSARDGKAYFEYINGENLGDKLCSLFKAGKEQEADIIVEKYVRTVKGLAVKPEAEISDAFKNVFFDMDFSCISDENISSLKITDIDLNFDNLFITGENKLTAIDYEWVFDFDIPVGYVIYRALKYLSIDITGLVDEYKNTLAKFCRKYGISEQEAELFEKMDDAFGAYVRDGRHIIGELAKTIGKKTIVINNGAGISIDSLMEAERKSEALKEYCDAYELELAKSRDDVKNLREYCAAYELELDKSRNEAEQLRRKCEAYEQDVREFDKSICGKMYRKLGK